MLTLAVATGAAAWRLAGALEAERAWRYASAAVSWWALLLLPVHLLGAVWLATGWRTVSLEGWAALAVATALAVFAAVPRGRTALSTTTAPPWWTVASHTGTYSSSVAIRASDRISFYRFILCEYMSDKGRGNRS